MTLWFRKRLELTWASQFCFHKNSVELVNKNDFFFQRLQGKPILNRYLIFISAYTYSCSLQVSEG